MPNAASFVRWFKDIGLGEVPLVGGKNASLGELYRELGRAGVRSSRAFRWQTWRISPSEAWRSAMR